ncbi:MAG: hypothetical protein IMHGJWDQ_001500 [Candidatus Fervidibacter sp.]
MEWLVATNSEAETKSLGRQLAQLLQGGEVICLIGELGSGKTTFVQGLAEGLGISLLIISPTFTLVREYAGRLPLFHVDAYRLQNLSAEEVQQQIGLWEYMERGGVVVVEWADLIDDALPKERLDIFFRHTREGRQLHFQPRGQRYEKLLEAFLAQRSEGQC